MFEIFWHTSWLLNALTVSCFGLKCNTRNAVCGRDRKNTACISQDWGCVQAIYGSWGKKVTKQVLLALWALMTHWRKRFLGTDTGCVGYCCFASLLCSYAALTVGYWWETLYTTKQFTLSVLIWSITWLTELCPSWFHFYRIRSEIFNFWQGNYHIFLVRLFL